MQNNPVLPECQFDTMDVREKARKHYAQALRYNASGARVNHNLDHLAMAMDIRQIAKRVEDPDHIHSTENAASLGLTPEVSYYIRKDGTWNAYRDYILMTYRVDMGPVPDDAEKPSLAKIEGTIQNWLNGEPLLFY